MESYAKFWEDDLGRKHSKVYPDIYFDGYIGIKKIPLCNCQKCGKKIVYYKNEYEAYDPLSGAFKHYAADNNYCEECARKITGVLRKMCIDTNIFAPTVTIGGWYKEGWLVTEYIQSQGEEVSPEYDPFCARIGTDLILGAKLTKGQKKKEDN